MTFVATDPTTAPTEAEREVREINALNMQLAFDRARLDAAVERLLDTDAETLAIPTCYVEGRPKPLTGSKVHIVHEEWTDGRLRPLDRVHAIEDCPGYWCHKDGQPRRFKPRDGISFAFRGEWQLVAYSGDNAILLRDEVSA